MTRSDFIRIAEILNRNKVSDPNTGVDYADYDKLVDAFCNYFIKVNPRFSQAKFLAAVYENPDYEKVMTKLNGKGNTNG